MKTAKRRKNPKKEHVILKKTPLLPGLLSKCHPRFDKTRTNGRSCLPAKYHNIVMKGLAKEKCSVGQERCAVKNTTVLTEEEKKNLLKTYFRPEMPKEWLEKPNAWLSNLDIEAVMSQYEEAVPSFKFLGVVPINFSSPDPYIGERVVGGAPKCLADQFCHVDLKAEAARGITTIGAVFNLDPHDKGGSHWVACCIMLKKNAIYYFDSYGLPPPRQVGQFMRSFILQDKSLVLKYNGRRFQYGGSECGMYSMYFLLCMIYEVPFQKFVRHTVADKYMLDLRKILFSL